MKTLPARAKIGGLTLNAECGRPRPQQRPNGEALLPVQCRLIFHVAAPEDGRTPGRWQKYGLAAGAGGVTVEAAMKTLPARAKIVELPFV
jgi:hypothetical protein